ncbi:DUF6090 family protein [Ekhidna sp.]|uniref:DUF6090 family protein n=1 Tax=Ekhidna sp. TaxID=2608089 RepID=UPI0032969BB7
MKNINWLDHIANLLVVILGISIAFYLEGYKEEANNRTREEKYLESLIKDLEADIEALDTLQHVNEMIIKSIVTLSEATSGKGYEDLAQIRNDILTIQYNPPFVPQRTVYESIKSSGQIDKISDFDIRNEVIELYEQYYRGTNQYDEALNEHVRDFIKPYFMKNMKFTSRSTVADDFLRDNEFQNMIYAYRFLFTAKDGFYTEVKEKVEDVKEKLDEYLTGLK